MTAAVPVVVLAGPSGTGKTTLAHRLVDGSDRYVFSVSATTRRPREGERDGVDYHFIDRPRFEQLIEAGELVEWAEVHGRLYGTPRAELDRATSRGQYVVLDIDVQGARQIRSAVPEARLIFVLPPDVDIMLSRLSGRGTETRGEIARRLQSALEELRAVSEFDYVLVNDDLDRCVGVIRRIVEDGDRPSADGHAPDIEVYRSEIERILDERFGSYEPR